MQQDQYPGLEIEADSHQQRREWVMERIAWVVLTLLLLAIACGLFGRGGPLSSREIVSADGRIRMQYERFIRYHSHDALRLILHVTTPSVGVKFGSDYIRNVQMDEITPRPHREVSEDGAVTYLFESSPQASMHVTFHFAPEKFGQLDGWLSVNDGPRHDFSQFVYP